MHFIKDIVALSALLAIGSSSVVKRADEHGTFQAVPCMTLLSLTRIVNKT